MKANNTNPKNLEDLIVDEFSSPCTVMATPLTSLKEIMELMEENNVRHIPIVEGDEIRGIISDRDLRAINGRSWAEKLTAQELMVTDPYIVDDRTALHEVVYEMSNRKIGSAIIRYPQGDLGIFTSIDALNALLELLRGDL